MLPNRTAGNPACRELRYSRGRGVRREAACFPVYLSATRAAATRRSPAEADRTADPPSATMCYMKVGVRELRQNLSIYLARVIAGEALEVTDRGHAVAILAPLVHGESVLSRLKREGRVIPATAELRNDRKPRGRRTSRSASRELQRDRADRAL